MKEEKKLNHILIRVILLCAGLSVMAIGVAIFDQGCFGHFSHIQCPFCDRDDFRPFRGDDHDYNELYICSYSDPYPEKKI